MPKLLAYILLSSLLLPFAACYTWMHLEKRLVRRAVKQQLPAGMDKEALTLLAFSLEEADRQLEWHLL